MEGTTVAPSGVQIESEVRGQQGRSTSGVKNFFAGGFGGVCGITIGHPFDTIKVRIINCYYPRTLPSAVCIIACLEVCY